MKAETKAVTLEALGFSGYAEYLESRHWKNFRESYRKSGLPQCCLACGKTPFSLHHRTYRNLGNELMTDVIPLCRECHQLVHDYLRATKTCVEDTHAALRRIRGWSRTETKKRFRKFTTGRTSDFRWIPIQTKPHSGPIARKPLPENVRRANAEWDRIHGPAKVITLARKESP